MDAAVPQTEKPQGTGTPDDCQFWYTTTLFGLKNTKKCVYLRQNWPNGANVGQKK